MAKKKDFKVDGKELRPIIPILPIVQSDLKNTISTLSIELPNGRDVKFDYGEYLGFGFDDSISAIVQEMRLMALQGVPEPLALYTIAGSGIRYWFRFCVQSARDGKPPTLRNINAEMIEIFCGLLNTRVKKMGRSGQGTLRVRYIKKSRQCLKHLWSAD